VNQFNVYVVILYFFVLCILAVFGVHRYYLAYLYLKNKDSHHKPKRKFDQLPTVTIQLPCTTRCTWPTA